MPGTFALEVLTPERVVLKVAAEALVLRSTIGGLTILDGHAALIAEVVPCDARVESGGTEVHLAVHGGFLQVDTSAGALDAPELADLEVGTGPIAGLSTRVTLLAGIAELAEEIDVDRARRANEDAERQLDPGARTGSAPDDAESELSVEQRLLRESFDRAELRLAVSGAPSS